MINKLKSNEVDIIVALIEGLINEIANGSEGEGESLYAKIQRIS
jgi:hypothetical protein